MALPIVVIHCGYASYLVRALVQAQVTNPRSQVVLLGDESNELITCVRHERYAAHLNAEAEHFESLYVDKHLSFNPYQADLFCFHRWFALKEFMRRNQIEQCFHIDSDILLYTDITKDFEQFQQYEMAYSYVGSGHGAFVTYAGIERFCRHLIEFYTDPALYAILQSIREEQLQKMKAQNIPQWKVGGIVDMTLFYQFYLRNQDKIGDTSAIANKAMHDSSINVSRGFEMKDGIKHVTWIKGKPYGKLTETGELIFFKSLHFQGHAKRLIPQYTTGGQLRSLYYRGKGYVKYYAQPRLQQKLKALSGKAAKA